MAAASPRKVVICNARGLHARASAKFVETACRYEAEVIVRKDAMEVAGSSIMGLMMLAAGPGAELTLAAEGPDAEAALDALTELIEAKFHEGE